MFWAEDPRTSLSQYSPGDRGLDFENLPPKPYRPSSKPAFVAVCLWAGGSVSLSLVLHLRETLVTGPPPRAQGQVLQCHLAFVLCIRSECPWLPPGLRVNFHVEGHKVLIGEGFQLG